MQIKHVTVGMLLGLFTLCPLRHAVADGMMAKEVPLMNIIDTPAYAVVIEKLEDVQGKPALSAVVRAIYGSGNRPLASKSLKIGQRTVFPLYRAPAPVAGKWVIAKRYWNVCSEANPKRLLLVSGYRYFEKLCDTKSNRRMLKEIFTQKDARERYQKRPTALLRRGLGHPDTYFWAWQELNKRHALRSRDAITAAERLPKRCSLSPLKNFYSNIEGPEKAAFAKKVIAQLAKEKGGRAANFVRYLLKTTKHRYLLVPIMRQMIRVKLRYKLTVRRSCAIVSRLTLHLQTKVSADERKAGHALLAWMGQHKAFDKHCADDKNKLKQALGKAAAKK